MATHAERNALRLGIADQVRVSMAAQASDILRASLAGTVDGQKRQRVLRRFAERVLAEPEPWVTKFALAIASSVPDAMIGADDTVADDDIDGMVSLAFDAFSGVELKWAEETLPA